MTSAHDTVTDAGPKGRPLIMLAVLLSTWLGFRLMMWESQLPIIHDSLASPNQMRSNAITNTAESVDANRPDLVGKNGRAPANPRQRLNGTGQWSQTDAIRLESVERSAQQPYDPDRIGNAPAGHQLVWMAAMSYLPIPDAIDGREIFEAPDNPSWLAPANKRNVDRWSIDAWAFWRDSGSQTVVSAGRAPTYGASQAGAVLNFRLSPNSRRDPRAYARIYRALIDGGEAEIAAGFSMSPIADAPFRAHAEVRVTEFETTTEVRPAFFVTTQLPRARLPLDAYAEAYVQAGYVGGENSTPFADGQVHIMRDVTSFDLGDISVGGAAWAGAQDDAQRIDVGPSLRFDLHIGKVPARVSVDYRERVSGGAEPPSGVAVTLSSRF